jgi:hypothetical protein
MKTNDHPEYPAPDSRVLAFSEKEKTWLPLFWSPDHDFWILELKSGSAEVFSRGDISKWMEMPAAPNCAPVFG